jgi:signal transduction histidine kinase
VVIVNDILDLEKIVAGKLQLEVIPFKIVDKIATIIQSFIYRAEEKELGLIYQNFHPGRPCRQRRSLPAQPGIEQYSE